MSSIFICYRRNNSAVEANSIAQSIKQRIRNKVFLDTSSIMAGENWPDRLKEELLKAKIVIIIIDSNWLLTFDEHGRRRIDNPEDWVRKEIETSLKHKIKILPILIGEATKMPSKEALPKPIKKISSRQFIKLRKEYWEHDIQLLLAQIDDQITEQSETYCELDPFPKSPYEPADPISEEKLIRILKNELPEWKQSISQLPSKEGKVRMEIKRVYKFKSFQFAINFMAQVSIGCDIAMHHPRWENIWKTLTVYLSTWDHGLHKVTDRDIKLAKYFDRSYRKFNGAVTNAK